MSDGREAGFRITEILELDNKTVFGYQWVCNDPECPGAGFPKPTEKEAFVEAGVHWMNEHLRGNSNGETSQV